MKLSIVENINKVNLKDTKTITILVIFVIILFAIVYVWQNKKNVDEGFANYNVNEGDVVGLPNLDSVYVGSKPLPTTLNEFIDARNATTLANTFAKISALNTTIANVNANTQLIQETKNSVDQLTSKLNNDINNMNNNITSNIALMNTNLTNSITNMNNILTSNIANAPPPLTVIAFYGSVAPTGWQLCDGQDLQALNGLVVHYTTSTGAVARLKTPNLLGRFILGATTNINANSFISSNIALRNDIGVIGGEEQVKLDIKEMPAHLHPINVARSTNEGCARDRTAPVGEGAGITTGCEGQFTNEPNRIYDPYNRKFIGYTGGDPSIQIADSYFPADTNKKMNDTKPHNNMPPYYTLIYIIKKPARGGELNPVLLPSPSFQNKSYIP